MRKVALTLFGLCTSISQALNPPPNITECNGSAAICSRKYSNVSLIGTHGSAHIGGIHDWRINQERSVTFQLDSGIRFLQAQTHQEWICEVRDDCPDNSARHVIEEMCDPRIRYIGNSPQQFLIANLDACFRRNNP